MIKYLKIQKQTCPTSTTQIIVVISFKAKSFVQYRLLIQQA